MKKFITFLSAVLLTVSVFAQSPEKMSYQAVIRNSSNQLVTNQAVGMQISILQGSASGTAVYVETQTPTTNANGLISIEIGGGTVINGDFATIDWANGLYFIKTETDPSGGSTYTIAGTSQLLSVPYALHGKTAELATETDPLFVASPANKITSGDITSWNNKLEVEQDSSVTNEIQALSISNDTVFLSNGGFIKLPKVYSSSNNFYLGQDTLGGIVFYIYIGSNGQQHGLIVSKTESTGIWSGSGSTLVGADRTEDGVYNTNLMPTGAGTAKTWVTGLGVGWYLPSIDELSLLWRNRYHVNKTARAVSATLLSDNDAYWSSTECSATGASGFGFEDGDPGYCNKPSLFSVRAVRAF